MQNEEFFSIYGSGYGQQRREGLELFWRAIPHHIRLADAAASCIDSIRNRRATMRAHHAIAIAAVLLVGFGLKLVFFSAPAGADVASVKNVGVDVSQMHRNIKNLPAEKFHDMTFVFSEGD
jgi:hypothetical protein